MGCFSLPCLRWSSKRGPLSTTSSEKASYTPRPHHTSTISTSSAFSDVEKPLLGRSLFHRDSKRISALPSTVTTSIRPHVNPAFSAYSTPANYIDSAEGLRQRGIPVKRNTCSTDETTLSASSGTAWGDSPSSTKVADSPTDVPFGPLSSKTKGDGPADEVDEAELERERARKAEEARLEVDATELEHMDFMQMM